MIVCTGPISSGTKLLASIVQGLGFDAFHTSMPAGPIGIPEAYDTGEDIQWWDYRWFKDARFVIITRDIEMVVASIQHREDLPAIPKDEPEIIEMHSRAILELHRIPDAWWMRYEDLVSDQVAQITALGSWLGVKPHAGMDIPAVYDGNERWRR